MTTDPPERGGAIETPERPMRATYVGVIVVEVIVLLALWAFGSIFRA